MRFYKSFLSVFGILLIVYGLIMNILMFALPWYPTYLYFILMGIGTVILVVDEPIRKTKKLTHKSKTIIQAVLLIGFIALFILLIKL